jgi:hypothetical protein
MPAPTRAPIAPASDGVRPAPASAASKMVRAGDPDLAQLVLGHFSLYIRAYGGKKGILDGSWKPPVIRTG